MSEAGEFCVFGAATEKNPPSEFKVCVRGETTVGHRMTAPAKQEQLSGSDIPE